MSTFEATHAERSAAEPAAIWALWSDPARWPDWNEQVERAELDGELAVGATARVKFRRGGTVKFEVVALEPERLLVDEARFPGARLRHEHRLDAGRSSVEISHRLYVSGPLAGFWSLLLGRKRMRESVARFVERERELTEPANQSRAAARRRRRKR
ncbi:MAG: SRPBCC family protein [Solirubrobacterales bacterium]